MQQEDWIKIAKWMGYLYLPIFILVIIIFALVQWNAHNIVQYKTIQSEASATSTRVR